MVLKGIEINRIAHLTGEVYNKPYAYFRVISVNWVSATTALELAPSAGQNILVLRIAFTLYNPATDFAQHIYLRGYNGKIWTTYSDAVGYADLGNCADDINSFKIGSDDVLQMVFRPKDGIKLDGDKGEKAKIEPSATISSGVDKFYGGFLYILY